MNTTNEDHQVEMDVRFGGVLLWSLAQAFLFGSVGRSDASDASDASTFARRFLRLTEAIPSV